MAAETEFGLLGPLLVRRAGVVTTVSAGKQRALLAALLLKANQVVSVGEISEVLWGPSPPSSERVTIQGLVKRLRRALDGAGDARIGTVPGGYLIRVETGELDVSRFDVTQDAAGKAARRGDWALAAAELRQGLSLWRGEPLADVESPVLVQRHLPWLAEKRLRALEARIDADLRLGGHTDLIAELRQLAGAHPLRERLHAQLMLALYRDGQQGEAPAAYQCARRVLIEELGAEPGPELRRVQEQILTGAPALQVIPVTHGRDSPAAGPQREYRVTTVVPRQLPAPVRYFAGRASELAALTSLLDRAGDDVSGTTGDLGHCRDRRGGQDRSGRALGSSGRRAVPRRTALCQPARLRPRPSDGSRRCAGRVPARSRGGPERHSGGRGRAGCSLPQSARCPQDARRPRQRIRCQPGPAAAARHALRDDHHQPRRADGAGGQGWRLAARPGPAASGGSGQPAAGSRRPGGR